MKFPYKKLSSGAVRPVMPLVVRNPKNGTAIKYHALVDSGADTCIFQIEIAELIGLDAESGEKQMVAGVVAGEKRPYYVHRVELEVGGWNFVTKVGFMPDLAKYGYGVLGQVGFFDAFKYVKFEKVAGFIELGSKL